MKEKLTQNVSMSSGEVTTEVAIAAFQALLNRRGLYYTFFQNYAINRKLHIETGWVDEWIKDVGVNEPEQWVFMSFVWEKTPQDKDVWMDLQTRWNRWCKYNLNK